MDVVDGNAIGALLIDVFGAEMTAAHSTCGTCGASRPMAELVVYQRAPGTVVRCRSCGSVLMVFVKAHGAVCVDLAGLATSGHSEAGHTQTSGTWRQPWTPDRHAGTNTEGTTMPHEEAMSMGTPDEEPMSMGTPDEEPMSMGTPQEEPTSMDTPDEQSMPTGTPQEEPTSMDTPHESM